MTIQEFLQTHYLHDSLVENISYENNIVDITIDFCFWMQEGYHDSDPETGIIKLHFTDVTSYSGPLGGIDSFSILEASYEDHCLRILLLDDFHNVSYKIQIVSQTGMVFII